MVEASALGPRKDKRGRLVCTCGGYIFPHRKGGGACEHSYTSVYHRARRDGLDHLDALAEWAWDTPPKPASSAQPVPF